MAKRPVKSLGPVPLTLTVPLWARAIETKRAHPILTDWHAVSTAGSLDFDFPGLRLRRITLTGACARTAVIDEMVRDRSRSDPRLLLVNLGEGLDNRFGRTGNGVMSCLDVDLPEVIALRAHFFPETRRHRSIAGNLLDEAWMDEVDAGFSTIVFVAEGVLMYLSEAGVRTLFARIAARFPGAEVIFDSLTPAFARFGARLELGPGFRARYQWGLPHSAGVETWAAGYELLERRSIFESHRSRFAFPLRALTRLFPRLAWAHSVNRVRLGGPKGAYDTSA